jgi:oligopeptidase B
VDQYISQRLFATAHDGTRVPISLLMKKGAKLDGTNPLFLYGYGSYGICTEPYFRSNVISLVDRGFVFAIAHIRGGSEMGREWYEQGRLKNKMNTFTDFIECARHLIGEKYTSAKHLYAMGGSAGGLLMGAVINLKPEIFNGVVAAVPFVDVLTTMLDESIPLTTSEYREWGDPRIKEDYFCMKAYSPYDNIEAKAYPHLLVTTGYHDSQVQYWEPAKWVARLRELKTDDNLLLLYTEMSAGHSGATGRFEMLKTVAL